MFGRGGDKVRSKATGEVFPVLRHEESSGNLRLEGLSNNEAHWCRVGDYEALPVPDATPSVAEAVGSLVAGLAHGAAALEATEPDPFPHTPPAVPVPEKRGAKS